MSDQDDVWVPQKVDRLRQALMNNPDAGYAFSDALVVDEALRPLGYTMWQSIAFTRGQRRQFERGGQMAVLLKHNVVTGATMAFRAGLKGIVLPISEEAIHDEWIALLASSVGMYGVLINEPLIQYRQHTQQMIGGEKVALAEQIKRATLTRGQSFESLLRNEEVKYSKALDRLASTGQLDRESRRLFNDKILHLRARSSLHRRPRYLRLIGVAKQLLTCRYHRLSGGWKSAARDLLL